MTALTLWSASVAARLAARVRRDDSGAALLIALGFITFFGVVIAATLSFADTGLRVNESVQAQRHEVYAADGAVEAAIATMRPDKNFGASSGSCPDQSFDGLGDGTTTVVVKCTAQPNSGVGGAGGGPSTAILTTGRHADLGEPGIYRSSSDVLRVQGNVISNSTIAGANNAKMDVTGSAWARGNCTPADMITASSGVACAQGNGSYSAADTPVATPIVSVPPTARTAPVCTGERLVTLEPGTYSDAAALTALTNNTTCAKSLIWLKPGAYYFNFTNPGSHVWLVQDANVNVVGGTAKDWSAATRPVVSFPGGCARATDPAPNDGVQLIFAGDSRLNVQSGSVELCAPPTGDQIAVIGSPGTQTAQSALVKPTGTPTAVTTFLNPAGANDIDEVPPSVATAAMTSATATSGSMTLAFAAPSPTAGSTITGATLRVKHMETGDMSKNDVVATLTTGTGAATKTCTLKPNTRAVLFEDTLDVGPTASGTPCITTLADLSTIKVKYDVTLASGRTKTATATLDGVRVDVTWLTAGLAPQSGCVTLPGYTVPGGDATHCPLVQTNGAQGNLAVTGGIHAPLAALDINLTNASSQLFLRGLVARTLFINVTPAATFGGAVISVPGGFVIRTPRDVELVAYIGSVEQLRARVQFDDGYDGSTPGQTVTVSRWNMLR